MSVAVLINRLSSVYSKIKTVNSVMFNKHLLLTNLGISLGLSGFGDVLQQNYMILQGEKKAWNKRRTFNMSVTGLTVGAVCHHWYNYLDKKLPGRTLKIVLKKCLIDQIFFSPFYISVFFVTIGLLENSSLSQTVKEIINKGKHLYVAEWIVWPPAQIINFYFLPTKYRVLYDNTISLGYDIYTSYVKHELEENADGKK
uniref:Pmp22 peroxisomal membrane protein, putative n=1 Tax=Riptortus pedestris TaxID=329032 RepID=R4WJ81_RIPPE|nr:pmp22 peroxisomal membrane protein, putative [Riptortus pedestris]